MLSYGYRTLEQTVPDGSIFVEVDGQRAALFPVAYSKWNGKHAEISLGEAYRFYLLWPNGEVRIVGHTGIQRIPSCERADKIRRIGRAAGYLPA